MRTIIITMAGQGQRFQNVGYKIPKYEIEVKGRSLFSWALNSLHNFLNTDSHLIFIARSEFSPKRFIEQECKKLEIKNFSTVLLNHLTNGQATSVLEARQASIKTQWPILIYNIDTHVNPAYLSPLMMQSNNWIPCFPGVGDSWSFVRVDTKNQALEVREKSRISSHATIGLYGFSSFEIFEAAYNEYYRDPQNIEHKERYIAPLYNQLIKRNNLVSIEVLPKSAVHPLGTPDEVDMFRNSTYG